jgi:hypothetical protein
MRFDSSYIKGTLLTYAPQCDKCQFSSLLNITVTHSQLSVLSTLLHMHGSMGGENIRRLWTANTSNHLSNKQ